MPRPPRATVAWAWAMGLTVTMSCGSHGMPPPMPGPVPFRADFGNHTLALGRFEVHAPEAPPEEAEVAALRQAFLAYLHQYVEFSDAADLATADMILDADVSAARNSAKGASPLSDMLGGRAWGEVAVSVSTTLRGRQGEALWAGQDSGHADFETLMFGWYGSRSIESAYSAAYGEAFDRVCKLLGGAREGVVARLGGPSPAVASARPVGKRSKIAVMATQADAASAALLPNVFDDCVLSAVQRIGAADTMGTEDINAMLGFERQKDLVGCNDTGCIASIGGALGADLLVMVRVARLNPEWAVSVKLINIRDVRVEARIADFVSGDVEVLMHAVPDIVQRLFAQRQ